MKKLLESFDDYALSVSVTTRKPRPGEVDGKDYFFRTKEEVEEMIAQDQLLEYARYPAAALAMTIFRSRKPRSLACASPIPGIRRQVWPIMPLC